MVIISVSDAMLLMPSVPGVMAMLNSISRAKEAATVLTQYSLSLLFMSKENTRAKTVLMRRFLCNESSSFLFSCRVLFLMVFLQLDISCFRLLFPSFGIYLDMLRKVGVS